MKSPILLSLTLISLAGADEMAGKSKQVARMDGAVKVIGALNNYGKYFADPGFQPIAH